MTLRKIFTALFALLLTAGILLVSDLGNRQHSKDTGIRKDGNYKIGITYFGPDASFDMVVDGLLHGLADLGYVKDKNLSLVMAHANGEISNLPLVHLNMDNSDVDLIIPTSTPGIASAVSTVKKHSMVFTMTYTPLAVGVGKSFTDHLPNLTGLASFPPVEKTFDFICESFPGTKRIGTLYNSSEANSRKVVEVARAYAESLGIELVETTVVNTSEVYQAMESLAQRNVDAVWITGDNTALQAFHAIVKVCDARELPLVVNDVEYTEQGALAAVGIGWYQTGYRTADYVVRVLEGANPVDIPIINYVEEAVAINRELAAQRGIVFPEKYTAQETFKPKKQYRFCMVHYIDSPNVDEIERGIRDQFSKNGLTEGVSYTLQTFNAQGDVSMLNSIANTLINDDSWDLIFSSSTPTAQLLSKKVTLCPLVFTAVGDPLTAGLGRSYDEHLPNITGVSNMSDFGKLLDILRETMSDAKRIGTVYTPGEANSVAYHKYLKEAAKARGFELVSVPANSATEVADAALALTGQKIDAFAQLSDNLVITSYPVILKTAYDHRIPYFCFQTTEVKDGGVAAVACDYYNVGECAVDAAMEILKGKDPADIPFRNIDHYPVSVNPRAEAYFQLTVPQKYKEKTVLNIRHQGPYRFCMVHYVDSPNSEDVEDGIRDGLKALNWVEDVDFTLQSFNAQGDISTMNSICDAVMGKPWDLVFVSSTPTTQLLAKKVTHAPVVFTAVGDPVAAGLGDSFEDHLPNITGISTLSDFDGLLQLLQETMPGVKTIGTVFTPGEINSVAYNTRLQAAARARGITLISMPANSVTEVSDAALSLAAQRIDAFTQISDNLTATCSAAIIKTAYENHIPYFGFISSQIDQGAVACFSRDYYRCGVEAVDLAMEILRGKDPEEMPYRMMGKSNVSVNEEAERYFEVKIPAHYLKENP